MTLFLGPGFGLGARWNRLVETVKTRKKREKTGKKWARYGLKNVNTGDLPGVKLALSLHAPNQALRYSIMPSARPFPLDKLMEAVDGYCERSGQKVFVQYIMLGGLNDGLEHAEELGALRNCSGAMLTVLLTRQYPCGQGRCWRGARWPRPT